MCIDHRNTILGAPLELHELYMTGDLTEKNNWKMSKMFVNFGVQNVTVYFPIQVVISHILCVMKFWSNDANVNFTDNMKFKLM